MAKARRVALLCIDPWHWAEGSQQKPFNYGARRIQAAILGHPELADCDVRLIESMSLDVDEVSSELEAFDPDFIGASAFVWSFPTLLEASRRAKLKRPDRTVIFGGPSARPEMLRLPQHRHGREVIDALVEGDGESTIEDLLLAPQLTSQTLRGISGLHLPDADGWHFTGKRTLPSPDAHPSPYQMGLVPPGRQADIESFRGCPLSCTYCEWGDTGVQSRTFGYEYLVKELTALKSAKAESIWLVDPALNLNHKAFQNLRRAEAEVGALRAVGGFRCEIYPSHMTDEHLAFLQDTKAAHAGIGLQSLDKEVLHALERPFDEKKFERVAREVASIVPDTVIEIIMGLPGDTPDNFKRTVERVSQLPVSLRIFHCLVLPSALMTRAPAEFDLKFDPFTLKMISCQGWSEKDFEDMYRWLDVNASPDSNNAKVRRAELNVPQARRTSKTSPVSRELHDALARSVRASSTWTLDGADALDGEDGRAGFIAHLRRADGVLDLRVWPWDGVAPRFLEADRIAYAYSGGGTSLDAQSAGTLKNVIRQIHPIAHAVIRGLGTASRSGAAPRVVPLGGVGPNRPESEIKL
jgi:radical SAM superfamily enzyme YgiQ (UPF0313 family)